MEVLSENIRRRPYLSRKAKSKLAPKQSVQKPKKKKRSTCDDIDSNKRKRRKRNTVCASRDQILMLVFFSKLTIRKPRF